MTVREKLRARDLLVAVLLISMGVYSLYLGAEQRQLSRCLSAFTSQSSQTSVIRSELTERESLAIRAIIRDVFTAVKTPADAQRAYRRYNMRLVAIDRERDANPVRRFSDERCDDYTD